MRGRPRLKKAEKLVQVAGAVPKEISDYIHGQATSDKRTVSQVVRRLIELGYKTETGEANGN